MAQIQLPEGIDRKEVVFLTLKWKWFVLIYLGYKREEYRDLTQYYEGAFEGKKYIHFRNGYGSDAPFILKRLQGHSVGVGNPEWGAPKEEVNILSIYGEIDKTPFSKMMEIVKKTKLNEEPVVPNPPTP